MDPSLTRQEVEDLYYGSETWERLEKVKGEVDPGDVFWNPQAVEA